jgi:glutathionylspermidine synthase
MQRIVINPRHNWQQIVESQGFVFHTPEGQPYWDESVYYHLTRSEVDALEAATYELDRMCLQAVQHVIDASLFDRFQIPAQFVDFVTQSWDRDELTIYGRFDLCFDGRRTPKLLEYNADTPTSLLEAAVVQWFWFKDTFPDGSPLRQAQGGTIGRVDQFNTIHERLIEAWKRLAGGASGAGTPVHFTAMEGNVEDFMTVTYLRDTAIQAGLATEYIDVERVGWNWGRERFVDQREQPIDRAFKLYPWDWMLREGFAPQLLRRTTRWLEAPWKMILSNKAILPVLYELFPDSPYLLKASFEPLAGPHVRKPMLGREGANIQTIAAGRVASETPGPYGGPFVYQELAPIPDFDGFHPVIGSWMVNGYASGIGIREDRTPVTGNLSRFVPHVFA